MRYRDGMDGTPNLLSGTEAAAALQLLHEAAFGYLAMVEPQGPYVLPFNFVYAAINSGGTPASEAAAPGAGSLTGRIYFHTGEGRKTAALAADPRVCLAITAGATFQRGDSPCADSFSYRSLLVWGQARRVDDPAMREAALRAIVAKYDPAAAGKPFEPRDFAQTILFELAIESASYKQEPAGAAG
jgi:nitroimidazol reductase NimA-like FMN-containing flavoprotein (pyridoxamine 5'-phosphate oxidase superfamily)